MHAADQSQVLVEEFSVIGKESSIKSAQRGSRQTFGRQSTKSMQMSGWP